MRFDHGPLVDAVGKQPRQGLSVSCRPAAQLIEIFGAAAKVPIRSDCIQTAWQAHWPHPSHRVTIDIPL